jgi:hypothetical protein
VPSRFNLLFVWSLVLLSGFALDYVNTALEQQYPKYVSFFFFLIILILSLFDTQHYFYQYNPTLQAQQILTKPQIVKEINPTSGRVVSLADYILWNHIFSKGWQHSQDIPYFSNFLRDDVNSLYGVDEADVYQGNLLAENDNIINAIDQNIYLTKNDNILLNSLSARFLLLQNVSYLLSPYPTVYSGVKTTAEHVAYNLPPIYLSRLPSSHRAYIVHQKIVASGNAANAILTSTGFNPKHMVILSQNDNEMVRNQNANKSDQATIIKSTDQEMLITAKTNSPGYVVIADTYYPGWHAVVNGKTTNILLANTFQDAIYVPQGKSQIRLYYAPFSFVIGSVISIITFIVLFIFLVLIDKKIIFSRIKLFS